MSKVQDYSHYLPIGRLRKVKTKENFIFLALKGGRGHLLEVVAYERYQWFETFGILENWSLRRDSRLREVEVRLH